MAKIKIKSKEGKGYIETCDKNGSPIQITDTGQIQIRVYYPDKKIWIRYAVGHIENLLKGTLRVKT